MRKKIDMTGKRYDKLVAIKETRKNKHGKVMWLFKCDCGNEKEIYAYNVRKGATKSCGCHRDKVLSERATHNGSKHPLYNVWKGMKARCYNPLHKSYYRYGERGITICNEWLNNFNSFKDWSLSNGYNKNLTIDRIDNESGYSPENCRWVTMSVQALNKSNNVKRSVTIG